MPNIPPYGGIFLWCVKYISAYDYLCVAIIDIQLIVCYNGNMKGFTTEEFKQHLANKAPNWELAGEYTNALTRTKFRHKICGNTYLKTPYNVTSKPHMCQFCNANKLRGEALFKKRVASKPNYEILDEYKNNRTKIIEN